MFDRGKMHEVFSIAFPRNVYLLYTLFPRSRWSQVPGQSTQP